MDYSMTTQFMMELIATAVMIVFGDGVCCACNLKKSKAQGGGWVVITIGWGLAVCMGVLIAGPYTGAHLNPTVTLGLAVAGKFPWANVVPYIVAQMIGGFIGAVVVWLFYRDHFKEANDPELVLGSFCTEPAVRNYPENFFSEFLASGLLVFIILAIGSAGNSMDFHYNIVGATASLQAGTTHIGLAALGPVPVTFLIIALGMSLGGTTGYAMNVARDLSPRIAHAILPIPGKRDSDWAYAWIPAIAPTLGGMVAGLCGAWLFAC